MAFFICPNCGARVVDADGLPRRMLAFPVDGHFDLAALRAQAVAWPGLEGMDLAKEVTCRQTYTWDETTWVWPNGSARQDAPRTSRCSMIPQPRHRAI